MNQNLVLFRMMEGQQINQYHLEKLLGAGGFGGVFLATEVVRDHAVRQLAVKIIPDNSDEQLSELITASALEHDHLVRSYSAGECNILNTPMLYLAMELADGSLEAQLNQGKLSPETIRQVLQQTALGFKYLHQKERVHRDLKPGNILLIKGRYKVSDFGLVRRLGAETYAKTVNPIGTIAYMPPEAFEGKIATAWDIWSLGIMAVQMITGKLPYEFDGQTQLMKRVMNVELNLPSIPREYDALVSGCLNPEWRDRWTVEAVLNYCEQSTKEVSSVFIAESSMADNKVKPNVIKEQSSATPMISPVEIVAKTSVKGGQIKDKKLWKNLIIPTIVGFFFLGITQAYGIYKYKQFPSSPQFLINTWLSSRFVEKTLIGDISTYGPLIYSPDGKYLANGLAYDHAIAIWDTVTGKVIRTLKGDSPVISAAYSPDGKYLASGGSDETITIWDAATGKKIRTLEGHSGNVSSVAYSSDGKYLASGSHDETIMIWDAATGKKIRTLEGHEKETYYQYKKNDVTGVSSVAYSPDGKYLVSGSNDSKIDDWIIIWDAATGKRIHTLKGESTVGSVAYSPDGKYLASESYAGNIIMVWDAATRKRVYAFNSNGSAKFSPDGKYLATSSFYKIMIWNLETGEVIRTFTSTAIGTLAYSPDGKYIAAADISDKIKIWQVEQ